MTKLNKHFSFIGLLFASILYSQIGIGTINPHPSAALELASANKGLILPQAALISKTDILTIPNPATGLVIYNTNNSAASVVDNIKVYADIPYVFNGTQWQDMMDDVKINTFLTLPEVFAKGRKTTTGTSCMNLNGASFALNSKDANIAADGTIVANKSGFYKFTISTGITAQALQYNPVLAYLGGTNSNDIRFSFAFRGEPTGYANRNVSYSSVVFLNAGDTSGYFQWILGNTSTCNVSNTINQQEVIWQYLGNL
ncbi:hypothetical protein [Chryseobacterium sp.]|uniref:hypothetical protein n=1 Tax=Chryseobacterium sp. TaxID=1871047 RepID=UPI0028A142BE|nr:hypothetical protein [Chryseobacterium sp.]